MAKRRRSIPTDVRLVVLHEAGHKCGNPACRNVLTLDLHHMEHVSDGGADTADNLLPLCGYCHDMHHAGEIPQASIRAWKFLLLALNEAFDRRSVDLLLVLAQVVQIQRVTGDGLPAYSALIAGGFASVYEGRVADGGSGTPVFHIRITPKGQAFVDGWKRGDQQAALGKST